MTTIHRFKGLLPLDQYKTVWLHAFKLRGNNDIQQIQVVLQNTVTCHPSSCSSCYQWTLLSIVGLAIHGWSVNIQLSSHWFIAPSKVGSWRRQFVDQRMEFVDVGLQQQLQLALDLFSSRWLGSSFICEASGEISLHASTRLKYLKFNKNLGNLGQNISILEYLNIWFPVQETCVAHKKRVYLKSKQKTIK